MSNGRRILALRPAAGSLPANTRIVELLRENYPDDDIDVFDVQPAIRKQHLTLVVNCLSTLWLYRKGLLAGTHRFRQSFWRTPYMHRAIRALIRRRFGAVDWAFTFQIQSLFDGSIPGVPHFVYTDHTHLANLEYPTFDRRKLFDERWIACEKEIYANASLTFVWSTNMIRTLVEEYGIDPRQVRCVFAGANSPVPDTVEDPDQRPAARRILFVGVDWERKGGPDFLDAVARLRQSVPDVTAVIVSAYQPDEEDWPAGVTFTGRISLEEIAAQFRLADLFCLPTYVEPFGIVFIEAMAWGLPIVSTRIGALPDLVTDDENGTLVEPGDVDGLTASLARIIDNTRLYRAMCRNARDRYDSRFNWRTIFTNIRAEIQTASAGMTRRDDQTPAVERAARGSISARPLDME